MEVTEFWHHFEMVTLLMAISIPICGTVVTCITCRTQRFNETIKLSYCGSVGIVQLWSVFSSDWLRAEQTFLINEGPNSLPILKKIGFTSGLWGTMVFSIGGIQSRAPHQVSYYVAHGSNLHEQHRQCLASGMDASLLFITGLLGGESKTWRGDLGNCLQEVFRLMSPCMVGACYLWSLWVLSFKLENRLTSLILSMYGFTLSVACCSLVVYVRYWFPQIHLSDGKMLTVEMGRAWQVSSVQSALLLVSAVYLRLFCPESARHPPTLPTTYSTTVFSNNSVHGSLEDGHKFICLSAAQESVRFVLERRT